MNIHDFGPWTLQGKCKGDVQLNGLADLLRRLAHFPQRDGQVLRPVGVQQGHLARHLLDDLVLAYRQVDRRALSFGLEHLLELVHVEILEDSDK